MLRTVVAALVLAAPALAGEVVRTEAVGLRFAVPKAWTRVPAASDVRAAQWKIPGAGAGADDGELVLFFFGKGKGGGVQDNVDRWLGQFTEPDGRSARDAAVTTIRTVNGLRVTSVDVAGNYRGAPMGGGSAQPKPDQRMLAAVVEGDEGPWFFKAVGPKATIDQAKAGFDEMLASVEAHR